MAKLHTNWGITFSSVTVDPERGIIDIEEENIYYNSRTNLHGAGTIDLERFPRAVQFGAYHPWRPQFQDPGPEVLPGVHVFVPQLRADKDEDGNWKLDRRGIAVPCELIAGQTRHKPRYPVIIRWVAGNATHIMFLKDARTAYDNLKVWASCGTGTGVNWVERETTFFSSEEKKKVSWKFHRQRDPYWWLGGVNCEWFIPELQEERIAASAAFPGIFLFGMGTGGSSRGPKMAANENETKWAYFKAYLVRKIVEHDPRTIKGPLADGWIGDGNGWAYKRFPRYVLWTHREWGDYEISPLINSEDVPELIASRRDTSRFNEVLKYLESFGVENLVIPKTGLTERFLRELREEYSQSKIDWAYHWAERHFSWERCDLLKVGESPVLCFWDETPSVHPFRRCPHRK